MGATKMQGTKSAPRSGRLVLVGVLLLAAAGCTNEQKAPERGPVIGSAQLALTAGCGNGVVETELGEICDDGNSSPFDGCSPSCTVEAGYVCVGERPSSCSPPDQSDGPGAYGAAQHSRALPPVSPFTGRDFWTGFIYNLGPTYPTALALKIAGDPGTTGRVENTAGTSVATFTIGATGVTTLDFNVATYHIVAEGSVTNQGLRVLADGEVRVLATNEYTYSTDSWAVWSSDKLGDSYSVLDIYTGNYAQLLLVGVQAATAVVIKDTAGTQVASFTLNVGQTYLYARPGTIAGYTVTSSKPVAAIGGNRCMNLPDTACDTTNEQLAPTRNWARDYVVGPTFNSTTAKSLHAVFAASDETAIVITRSDGTLQNLTLNKGQSQTFADTTAPGNLAYFVSADKPIAVASVVSDPAGAGVWDPALVFWPPIDGYVAEAKMPTSGRTIVYTNFLTLITRTSATGHLQVNGAAVAGWTAIASTGYSFAQVSVPEGDNEIVATDGVKFGAVAAGGADYVSYAYASPYDIATVGGTTTCYLGNGIPDYEAVLAGGAAASADDLEASDDEDALSGTISLRLGDAAPSLAVPCNDNYFGTDAKATVHGFVDFDRNGAFGPGESASAACNDPSMTADGSATLTWSNPSYSAAGATTIRLRICDDTSDCSAPSGAATSGEVEDHLVHLGECGDGFYDSFEGCDDGDLAAGDGCSPTCTVEPGFSCSGTPSVCLLTDAPVITLPTSGTLTNNPNPTVGGSCHTGAQVRVLEGAAALCTATCAGSAFSCTSMSLTDGAHALTADQSYDGFTSVPSTQVVLNVDTTIPDAPVVTSPASGALTNTTTPTVSGSCEPGATVRVLNGATQLCSAVCTAARTFSCTSSALAQGSVTLTSSQTDVGNRTSGLSNAVTITVDTTAPAIPTISAPAAGSTLNDATPTVSGTCETDAAVRVYEGLSQLCSATCAAGGFSCDTVALANGAHSVAARQSDPAGNTSAFSALRAFTVNAPPVQPTISAPAEGALVNTTVISVSCQNGNTVKVFEGATELCSGSCPGSTFTCMPAMGQGAHTVFARQIDPTAQVSPDSAPRSFTLDSAAPAAPTLGAPDQGSSNTDATPTFSGGCETDATVRVREGSELLCSAVCVAGSFSCDSWLPLSDGSHNVVARQTDAAGNPSPETAPRTFSVDNTPPAAPTLTFPSDGSTVGDATPAISGECEIGATVEVLEGATVLCGATCTAGAFNCEASTLSDASHTILARQTDAAGNLGPNSAARSFTIDTLAPAAPAIAAPADGALLADTSPTFSGSCESGATVQILEGATLLCSFTCADGAFSCDTSALSQGAHSVVARQIDAAGNVGANSAASAFTVDTLAPAAAAIAAPAAGAFLADTTPTVSGSCEEAATVTVLEGATVLCTATCADGLFACDAVLLTDGAHAVVARQTDPAGNTGAESAAVAFVVDTLAPAAPSITLPSDGLVTNVVNPELAGGCEGDATVEVLEGATALCTAFCADGLFTCTIATLTEGSHALHARQTDLAGNLGPDSAPIGILVDTSAPSAPVVAEPAAGLPLSDSTPTVSGGCESAATVAVYEGATLLCNAACLEGAFACDTLELSEGEHVLVVVQTDPAGNPSAGSEPRPFEVDTLAPQAPSIALPAPASLINDATPAVAGACESGATVTVLEGSTELCTASCVDEAFGCDSMALTDGAHAITARQTDPAGNSSPDAAEVSFDLDAEEPAAPVVSAPIGGEVLAQSVVMVSGGCESGATVEVNEAEALLCSAVCVDETFTCDTSALGEGNHDLVVSQTDPAGNSGAGTTLSVGVDTIAPEAPAITAPADGVRLADATPLVSGSCESGATVELLEGSAVLCESACVDSAFGCESSLLADGQHTLTAAQTDLGGNRSAESVAVEFEVDTTAPVAPTIDAPADEALLADATPGFGGTSEPGSTVTVWIDGEAACTAVVAEDGSWSCVAGDDLAEGLHAVQASAEDLLGNDSQASGVVAITVDTRAPGAPSLLSPSEGVLVGAHPTFSGLADAAASVEVRVDGEIACAALADAQGAFSCVSNLALADGSHQATAVASDAAGNASAPSDPVGFSVGSGLAPGAPVVSAPAADSVLGSSTPDYAGQAEPGATVTVSVDGVVVCAVAASAAGEFECSSTTSLPDGEHAVIATASNPAGTSQPSVEVRFSVDATAPAAPLLSAPVEGGEVGLEPSFTGSAEAGTTVEVSVDGAVVCTAVADPSGAFSCRAAEPLSAGEHTATATTTDAAGTLSPACEPVDFSALGGLPPSVSLRAPASGSMLASAAVTFIGDAQPGSTVEVMIDGAFACAATASPAGDWTCTAASVAEGEHGASATASNELGAGEPCPEVGFTVDTVVPQAPVLSTPADGATTNAWPRFSGTAEAGSAVRVLVDGRLICVARAAADGSFECVGPVPLAAGAHQARAVALDEAGNLSDPSEAHGFSVSVDEPLITAPAGGALTNDATPEFTGTAEPGDTVSVVVDGETACEAIADEAGAWSCTPQEPLADGTHAVQAVADDGFGSVKTTDDQSLAVDTVAPQAPVIDAPQGGTTVLGGQTAMGGTAEPGSVVTAVVDGAEVCTAIAGDDGRWSCTAELGDGDHTVTATATDKAGNGSEASAAVGFANDTELAAPAISLPGDEAVVDGPQISIAGTAVPRTTVTVTDELGNTLCTVEADELGDFACSAQAAAGERTIRAVSSWGSMTSPQSEPVRFTVLFDVGFVGGGVGCGCTSSGAGAWVWTVGLLAVAALRRRKAGQFEVPSR